MTIDPIVNPSIHANLVSSSTALSRRAVLRGTGALAAGALVTAALPRRVHAQSIGAAFLPPPEQARTRTLRFAHLTDIHVQPEDKASEGLTQCLHAVQELKDKPELIITGGDLIMDSFAADEARTKVQWDLFTKALKGECGLPTQHTIGNHDIWGWNNAKSKCTGDEPHYGKRWVMDALGLAKPYYSFERGGWKIIILDSIRPFDQKYLAYLDEAQMDWLAGELASSNGKPVMVVSHAPIYAGCVMLSDGKVENGMWQMTGRAMHMDAKKLSQLFLKHPNVKLCLSGHIHVLERATFQGVTYICDGAVCGAWWEMQKTTENDQPFKAGPGYGLFDLFDDGTFEHQYVDYGWQPVEV